VPSIYLFAAIGFLLGLLFGSFLNVCIARLPNHESIVHPGSHCLACGHSIRWYDNIPLLSWLILRTKCRDCHAQVSWQYPAVELAVALWGLFAADGIYVAAYWVKFSLAPAPPHGFGTLGILDCCGFFILGFLLIGLMVMDWQTHRLPDAFTLTGIAIGLFLVCVQAIFLVPGQDAVVLDSTHQLRLSSPGSFASQGNLFLTGPESLIFGRIAAVAGAALLLYAIGAIYKLTRKRDGMGLGDVKMLAMIAAFLGFWPAILALFAGVVAATGYALTLILRGKASATTRLPFGSFLALGGLFTALFGNPLIAWYTSLLR
jgi:leader peptidase (prepilin peptidase) / N-methyltransferase